MIGWLILRCLTKIVKRIFGQVSITFGYQFAGSICIGQFADDCGYSTIAIASPKSTDTNADTPAVGIVTPLSSWAFCMANLL